MSLIFTPLGIRGVFGESLTVGDVLKLSNIFGDHLGEGSTVVVGRDTRDSGPAVEKAVVSGLLSAGVHVINLGVAPTPMIEWAVDRLEADGGVIISASHNPPEWNALKLVGERGVLLHPDEMEALKEKFSKGEPKTVPWNKVGSYREVNLVDEYISEIESLVDGDRIRDAGFKVVLDLNGGAGAIVTPYLLHRLGVKVISLNSAPGIFVREMEPRPDTLGDLASTVKAVRADVGFAHDTDADRLTLVTEWGEILTEDITLALVVDYLLQKEGGGSLVVNVASSKMFDDIASSRGATVYRTPVGEAYVAHKMLEVNATVGGEGSCGGVIYPKFHVGRDGPLAAAIILERMSVEGKTLSQLVDELPKYYMRRESIPARVNWDEVSERLIKFAESRGMKVSTLDGVRMDTDDLWALIRPSKTEFKVRFVVEGRDKGEVDGLLDELMKLVMS